MKNRIVYSAAAFLALSTIGGAAIAGKGGHGFDKMDADGNGGISQQEIETARQARFKKMDADGNGHVTLEEMEAAGSERAGKRAARRFKHMDADGDGLVTADEIGDRMGKHFDKIDADGSGELSKDELRAAHKKMRGQRKNGRGAPDAE